MNKKNLKSKNPFVFFAVDFVQAKKKVTQNRQLLKIQNNLHIKIAM